jgi:hypothetical protein
VSSTVISFVRLAMATRLARVVRQEDLPVDAVLDEPRRPVTCGGGGRRQRGHCEHERRGGNDNCHHCSGAESTQRTRIRWPTRSAFGLDARVQHEQRVDGRVVPQRDV